MNSEKVKEIKRMLKYVIEQGALCVGKEDIVFAGINFVDILTLINELERENAELKKYRCDWLNSDKMHLQSEMEETEFELYCANKALKGVREEVKQLKERIAELEAMLRGEEE